MRVVVTVFLHQIGLVVSLLAQVAGLQQLVAVWTYVQDETVVGSPSVGRLNSGRGGFQVGGRGSPAYIKAVVGSKYQAVSGIVACAAEVASPDQMCQIVTEFEQNAVLVAAIENIVKGVESGRKVVRLRTTRHIDITLLIDDDFPAHFVGIVLAQSADGVQSVVARSPDIGAGQQLGSSIVEFSDDNVGPIIEMHG